MTALTIANTKKKRIIQLNLYISCSQVMHIEHFFFRSYTFMFYFLYEGLYIIIVAANVLSKLNEN